MHLAFFHAPWCAVCHEKAPVVEEIASAVGMSLERWDIDEDLGRTEADRRRIKTVPTLALIHGERVPFRLVGRMITPENVRHLLAQCSPNPGGAG
jgi:thiol-disulfide isomerase/thioredoxin